MNHSKEPASSRIEVMIRSRSRFVVIAVAALMIGFPGRGSARTDRDETSAAEVVVESEYDRLIREAAECIVASNWGSAFRKLNWAMELDEDRPEAYFIYGRAHYLRREYRAAERAYRKLLEVDPGLSEAWLEVAKLMILKGELNEALECTLKAIELSDPKDWKDFTFLGELYAEMQLRESAVNAFDNAGALIRESIDRVQLVITKVLESGDIYEISQYPEFVADLSTSEIVEIPSIQYHYRARTAPADLVERLERLKEDLATVEARKTEALAWIAR